MTAGQMLRPRDYQYEAAHAVGAAWRRGITRPAIELPTGSGKGHPLDTEVPTPRGLRLWGELATGDQVYGSDGRPVTVTAVFDRGQLDTYRVTFSDGVSVLTDAEHLWSVRDGKYRRTSREHRVMSTADLAVLTLKPGRGYRFRIPLTPAVSHPPAAVLPLAPYTVGALIANGGMLHSGTMLTTPDPEVPRRIRESGQECNLIADITPGICPRYSLPGLTRITRELGLRVHSRDKRIPRAYLESAIWQRTELLHGLMDGDGSSRAAAGRRACTYSTTSEHLTVDVIELVNSLGGTASTYKHDRGEKGIEYSVSILLPPKLSPFSPGGNKGTVPVTRRSLSCKRAIVSIEYVGKRSIRCITVDALDSLYLITRNYIVTHNTVIFSWVGRWWHDAVPEGFAAGVIVLVHRDELVQQAISKFHDVAPHLAVGVVKAQRREIGAQVIVASVLTLARNPALIEKLSHMIGLVIVDECHHSTSDSYLRILKGLGCYDGTALTLGVTATMMRSDRAALGSVWEEVVYTKTILWMIQHGHLADIKGYGVTAEDFDISKVHTRGGDFADDELGEALSNSSALSLAAAKYHEYAPGRRGLIFTPTVGTAHEAAEVFTAAGIPTLAVDGGMKLPERRAATEALLSGEVQALSNCALFTEGTDLPPAEVCVLLRPTKSASLYIQMVGRVLRPFPGKKHATLLDLAGNAGRHKAGLCTPGTLLGQEVYEGETLEEAAGRLAEIEESAALDEREHAERSMFGSEPGVISLEESEARELDLFGGSRQAWARTNDGYWFLATGKAYVIILPGEIEGTWNVGWHDVRPGIGGQLAEGVHDLGAAMGHGEQYAALFGEAISARKAAWRSRPATLKARYAASRMGITVTDSLTGGELAELVDVATASGKVDQRTRLWLAARGRTR